VQLNNKTLEKLRSLINEDIEYRSGPKLIDFFSSYGFDDIYESGFPSRWIYTDSKLADMNGTDKIKQCIIDVFNPINFIPDFTNLDRLIEEFNMYLDFDGFKIVRSNKSIKIITTNSKTSILEENIEFDDEYIHQEWKKALDRKSNGDLEGAITISRTMIESILKFILTKQEIEISENMDLSELYKKTAKSLNLAPEQHQEKIFQQILGGANGIISGLGSLRNKLGDSHGTNGLKIKPKERHSELAVNLAGTMAIFIYKTYQETKI
jgi:hypothetical protein